MNIVLVSLFNNRAERFRTLGTELTARGHRVVLVTSEHGDPLPFETVVIPFNRGTTALRHAVGIPLSVNIDEAARKRGSATYRSVSLLAHTFEALFSHPDKYGRWVRAVRRRIRTSSTFLADCDLIVAAPPPSSLLAGSVLARESAAPLLLDFQDLWVTGNDYYPYGRIRRMLDQRREKRVMSEAAACMTASETFTQRIHAAYPAMELDTLHIGVDPELWRRPTVRHDALTLAHFGVTCGGKRDVRPLLQTIRTLVDEGAIRPEELCVELYGEFDEPARRCVDALSLKDIVRYHGVVPPRDVPDLLGRTDVAVVLMWPEDRSNFPLKTRHYLAAGTTVLVLGASPDSEVARHMRGLPGVDICSSNRDVREALLSYAARHRSGETFRYEPAERLFAYNATAMADKFMELAGRVTGESR